MGVPSLSGLRRGVGEMPAAGIFLSYRVCDTGSVDKGGDGLAAKVAEFLRSLGYTVFFDVENLEGGDRWKQVGNLGREQRRC